MSSLSKSFGGLSSLSLKEEVIVTKKQGIVSILGSDVDRTDCVASLRRTLSADMSSKKWQAQHGFYPLKKIASSQELGVSITDSSSSEEEEEYEEASKHSSEHIWSSIQQDKNKKELEKPSQFDMWSSIISQKKQDDHDSSPNPPAPYVHPLVKRSTSSLSEKSLEICTESLGSETGSDGFSSYPPSETGDAEEDKEVEHEHPVEEKVAVPKYDTEEVQVVKYNFAAAAKKSSPRSFPPPIPSLSKRDGASVHMRSRRDNGRLVLEAVSVPSQNNFRAQRQGGRLVLTFLNAAEDKEEMKKNDQAEQFDVEMENSEGGKGYAEEEEEDEEEVEMEEEDNYVELRDSERGRGEGGGEEEDVAFVMEQTPKMPSSGVISVHRLALVMNKPLVLSNRNPTWPNKFNEVVKSDQAGEGGVFQEVTPLTQSLPPRPPVAGRMISSAPQAALAASAAVSFNPCEYFWKPKPMPASIFSPITKKPASSPPGTNNNFLSLSKNLMPKDQQELVLLRGNKQQGDCFVPSLKGCKEPRRVLFWEPHCIATS